ncbi:MAG: SCO family protein [Hyphomicrobiaceae bacterium]|nr:MAG: SCO family protein [Hyphomicrobiaceae bacterium]
MRKAGVLLAAMLTLLLSRPALCDGKAENAVRLSQSALGNRLPELTFTGTEGQSVRLSDYRGKPLLISLVYTGCADVCPTQLESMIPAIKAAQRALGADSFSAITIGFDTKNDTPSRLKSFARTRGAVLPNWKFLAADEETLEALSKSVGFGFYSRAGGFDHLAQVSVIDGEGRLYQQLYGAVFEPPLVVEPLKALVFNRNKPLVSVAALIDRIKWFCTVYDPAAGRYYFNYSLFLSIGIGLVCFGLVLAFMLKEWRQLSSRASQPK